MVRSYSLLPSPIDTLLLVGRPGVLEGVYVAGLPNAPDPSAEGWARDDAVLAGARRQIEEYFAGDRTDFDLRIEAPTGSAWQRAVWGGLRAIPHGATVTYGELAARLGRPTAARAVGGANGANPVSIVVPCHRVVAAGGGLGGYAWGTDRKRWLLAHEHGRSPAGTGLAAPGRLPLR